MKSDVPRKISRGDYFRFFFRILMFFYLDFTILRILISLERGVGGLKTLRVFCTRNYVTEQ